MKGYPLDQLNEEVAYIAYHFHWPLETILNLEHRQRRAWVKEISKINKLKPNYESCECLPLCNEIKYSYVSERFAYPKNYVSGGEDHLKRYKL